MYSVDWSFLFVRPSDRSSDERHATDPILTGRWLARAHPTVWALGLTSLLTDVSSEMVASVLPLYLVLHLGMSPLAFGVVDGLYQGIAALVRVAAGVLSDRWRRPKAIALGGYALSAACRGLLLVCGNVWSSIAGVIVADRIGKGIRTAPRDAMISACSPPALLATAFGVHRSLDAAGAMLGPVVAFAVLAAAPGGYDLLFIISLVVAVLGVSVIGLFVPGDRCGGGAPPANLASPGDHPSEFLGDRDYRRLVAAGTILGLATVSDAFIFLLVQRRVELPAMAFPLLYVGTSLFTAICAIPCGRLADHFGRRRILFAGYILLGSVYALLIAPTRVPPAIFAGLVVVTLGGYYAATDGVLTAMAAARLSPSGTGTGLSVLATSTNLARLAASVMFGWVWTMRGISLAAAASLGLLAVAMAIASRLMPRDTVNVHIG